MFGRVLTVALIVVILWTALSVRLFTLQIMKNDEYQKQVIEQMTNEFKTSAERGKIFDSEMNLLVTNTTVYRVFISPAAIRTFENTSDKYSSGDVAQIIADELVRVLGVNRKTVLEESQKLDKQDRTIMRNVSPEKAEELRAFIKNNGFTGLLNIAAESQRYYCYGNLASHLIGFTNADGDGTYGIEATYNDYLKGTSGKYITARNALGGDMPFKYESYVGAENGANLVTTISMRLQSALENELQAAYESSQAENRVCGVVMDVNTGGILASAVVPGYDCNDPYALSEEHLKILDESGYLEGSDEYNTFRSNLIFSMWNNKVVNEPYEPGSTFKIITSAIAIEEGLIDFDKTFTCTGKYYVEGYGYISCHRTSGHGEVTFARGLQQSCNPLMMNTIEKIGVDTFYKYFEALGYTSKTGVDLPGEAYGSYHQKENMGNTELAVYSFGQTFKATPLQQLTAICTIANGGYLVTPHVIKDMVDDDGNVIYSYEDTPKVQIFSEETCKTVTNILAEGVATDGGAKNAYTKGYSVAAKTGTSQKQDKYVYYDAEGNVVSADDEWVDYDRPYRVGSTVAFAPADDPQIAVIIIVDEPSQGGSYGSIVAAPYISNFLSVALPYLGYEPQGGAGGATDVYVRDYTGLQVEKATLNITDKKLRFEIIGKGDYIMSQVPEGGTRLLTESGTVYLYVGDAEPSDTIEVPDVMGQTATHCNKLLVNSRLNVKIEGAMNYNVGTGAVVIRQSPEAGTLVPPGTIVTVEFRYMDGTD